jgi:two-component system, LytTR family, response regulator LytT
MDQRTISSIMEVIGEFVGDETSIAVADDQQFIFYQPSKKIDLKIRPGDRLQEGTVSYQALTYHQKVAQYVESDLFGVSYFGMSVPILDGANAKVCVTAILPSKPKKKAPPFVVVKTDDRWTPVPYEQIIYLETQNRKTMVKSDREYGSNKYHLNELEWFLPEDIFVRCHRSYIVNIQHIADIYPDCHSTFLLVMKDKSRIPVSQGYASYFRRILGF